MDISLPLCINRLVCTYFSEENLIRVMNKKNINLLYEKWKNGKIKKMILKFIKI